MLIEASLDIGSVISTSTIERTKARSIASICISTEAFLTRSSGEFGSRTIALSGHVIADSSILARSIGTCVGYSVELDINSSRIEDKHSVFEIIVPTTSQQIFESDNEEFSEVVHIQADMSHIRILRVVQRRNRVVFLSSTTVSIRDEEETEISSCRDVLCSHSHSSEDARTITRVVDISEENVFLDIGYRIAIFGICEITELVSISSTFKHIRDRKVCCSVEFHGGNGRRVTNKDAWWRHWRRGEIISNLSSHVFEIKSGECAVCWRSSTSSVA